jgi:hypothetical protein
VPELRRRAPQGVQPGRRHVQRLRVLPDRLPLRERDVRCARVGVEFVRFGFVGLRVGFFRVGFFWVWFFRVRFFRVRCFWVWCGEQVRIADEVRVLRKQLVVRSSLLTRLSTRKESR